MKRLTIRTLQGDAYYKPMGIDCGNCDTCERRMSHMSKLADRLADYEDTGLEPEEIQSLCEMDKRSRMAQMLRWEEAEKAGRLVVLPERKAPWVKAILAERDRQDLKWGFPQENTYCEWASILAEEAGELCKELNELNFGRGDLDRMETEAIQVAAVALSIIEQAAVAHRVTEQIAIALGRMIRQEAEEVLKNADN